MANLPQPRYRTLGSGLVFVLAVATGLYAVYVKHQWGYGVAFWVLAIGALVFAEKGDKTTKVSTPLFTFEFQGDEAPPYRFVEDEATFAVEGEEEAPLVGVEGDEESDAHAGETGTEG